MAMPTTTYKPSPLGYGSPRSSPFRRPESPASPSATALRQSTPPTSPSKLGGGVDTITPSRLSSLPPASPSASQDTNKPRRISHDANNMPLASSLGSPVHMATSFSHPQPTTTNNNNNNNNNALSQLQPAQIHALRDGFQLLDRNSDGRVDRDDVIDMLTQLGLSARPSDISPFFPAGHPPQMTLAVFLNSLAASLVNISAPSELLSAFAAFDDDDSGQVDVAELKDALLSTAPDNGDRKLSAAEVDKIVAGFSGRRAFGKHVASGRGKRGDVFRYQEFATSIVGGNEQVEAKDDGADG